MGPWEHGLLAHAPPTCSPAHLLGSQPRLEAVDRQARAVAAPQLLACKALQQLVLGAKPVEQQRVAGPQLGPPAPKLRGEALPQRRVFGRVALWQRSQQVPQAGRLPLLSRLSSQTLQLQLCQCASAAGAGGVALEERADQVRGGGGRGRRGCTAAPAAPSLPLAPAALPLVLQIRGEMVMSSACALHENGCCKLRCKLPAKAATPGSRPPLGAPSCLALRAAAGLLRILLFRCLLSPPLALAPGHPGCFCCLSCFELRARRRSGARGGARS